MRILLTNDDGINAPGLQVLKKIAAELSDDLWIVAPETDQSGLSHSLTLNDPLRLRKLEENTFALRGTPTDCVIMGVREVLPEPPDLVLSGVNSGQNISDDVTYSGTIAAAMEGTMLQIPSIALSQAYNWHSGRKIPWEVSSTFGSKIIQQILELGISAGTLVNINFPNCEVSDVSGIEITRQGRLTHGLFVEERHDGRRNPYYWLTYRRQAQETIAGTDLNALQEKRISVTPLRLDLTADLEMQRYTALSI